MDRSCPMLAKSESRSSHREWIICFIHDRTRTPAVGEFYTAGQLGKFLVDAMAFVEPRACVKAN